jgi:hypothetical protein
VDCPAFNGEIEVRDDRRHNTLWRAVYKTKTTNLNPHPATSKRLDLDTRYQLFDIGSADRPCCLIGAFYDSEEEG